MAFAQAPVPPLWGAVAASVASVAVPRLPRSGAVGEMSVPALPSLRAETIAEGGARWYAFPDGRRYPSVTTVLTLLARPGLERWRLREGLAAARQVLEASLGRPLQPEIVDLALEEAMRRPDALRDGAARWGSGIHRFMETGDIDAAPPHLRPGLRAALEFVASLKPAARYVERLVASDDLRVAGRLDLAVAVGRGWALLDIKTGQVRLEHRLQLGGYATCLEELSKAPVQAAYLVRLPRDGRALEVHEVPDLSKWREAFGHLCRLFWLLNGPE